jgi:hypothetical protein
MSDYLLPLLSLVRPGAACLTIPRVLTWWRPVATGALCAACVAVAGHATIARAVVAHLPHSATPEDVIQVRAWLDADLLPRTVLLPVRVGAESALGGFLLLILARGFLGGSGGTFRGCFVLSLVASVIQLAGRLAAIVFSLIHGGSSGSLFAVPWTLASAFPGERDYRAILLLTSLNLFTLWHVCFLTLGLAVLCTCKVWKAFLVAVTAWTLSAAFSTAVLVLLRSAFQFGL